MKTYVLHEDHSYSEVDALDYAKSGQLTEHAELRNVGDEDIAGYRVSTKFIGIDSTPSFLRLRFPDAPPRVFECAVFDPKGDINVMGRPSTWADAEEMHKTVCASLRMLEKDVGITDSIIDVVRAGLRFR